MILVAEVQQKNEELLTEITKLTEVIHKQAVAYWQKNQG